LMFVSVCTDTLLYLTWMPDCGAPVRIVTYYVVEFLAVYMLYICCIVVAHFMRSL
jgi:hypothetical protein